MADIQKYIQEKNNRLAKRNKQRKDMTAMNMIFDMFNKGDNVATFKASIQEMFDANPVGFYLKFIQPIQPKGIPLFIGDTNTEQDLEEDATDMTNLDLSKLSPDELYKLKEIVDKAKADNTIDV